MKRQESEMIKKAKGRLSSATGVTMVELLVVVAIITILSGVAFIAVWNYQRSMGQLERDNIAKEIFIAAQNHLTVAKGEGYLGLGTDSTNFGQEGTATEDSGKNVYYYVVNNGAASSGEGMFAQMLPFGSIDETIRTGGSYLIRYQPKAGLVLDVFYCSTSGSPSKFNHQLSEDEYSQVMALKGNDHKGARRTYTYKGGNSILGWYGGEDAANLPTISLKAPSIEVFNGDTLYVKVTDAPENTGVHSLKLILTGKLSGAQKSFVLKKSSESSETVDTSDRLTVSGTEYDLLLDDITKSGMHFRTIPGELKDALNNIISFIPGEDVTVQAVAYSTSALANTVYSESRTTNSLFADIADIRDASGNAGTDNVFETAYISSIRHLENLGQNISKLGAIPTPTNKIFIKNAEQTTDLNWSTFQQNIRKITKNDDDVFIYYLNETATECIPTNPGTFCPVDIPTMYYFNGFHITSGITLQYDGKQHSISGIEINFDGNGGLFNIITPYSSVSNLRLIDFDITASKAGCSAGALAGTMSGGCSVSNVVAFNSPEKDSEFSSSTPNVSATATNGVAGGLIGSMSDGSSLKYCAASLYVKGDSAAGGLVGKSEGSEGSITGCYSGGHTDQGEYYKHNSNGRTVPIYNVTADSGGVAGGLVGDAGSSTILNSYSTCSVFGTTAGGFVGSASGDITNCYATGLVSKSEITTDNDRTMNNAKGAFAGSYSRTATNCGYYSIINEVLKSETVNGETTKTLDHYLGAVGDGDAASTSDITPFDLNAETFNTFTGAWDNWAPAKPYDSTLVGNYGGKYNLKAILRPIWTKTTESIITPDPNNTGLVNSGSLDGSAITDYFVSTHYGDWPSPEVFFINTK